MLNLIKQPQKFAYIFHYLVSRNHKMLGAVRPLVVLINYSQANLYGKMHSRNLLLSNASYGIVISRQKSKGKKNIGTRKHQIQEDDSDDDDDDFKENEDEYVQDGAQVKTYSLPSVRVDLILKQVLNQKRKKIEECFYSNKIRINGKVLLKKAGTAKIGDEIDVIKGIFKDSSELIDVARVEILSIEEDNDEDEKVLVKVKRFKSLLIENYPDGDKWKEPEPEVSD